jgi:hypothetical protein
MSDRVQYERCDSYEDQLRVVFLSCASSAAEADAEALSAASLLNLCNALELSGDRAGGLVRRLVEGHADEQGRG